MSEDLKDVSETKTAAGKGKSSKSFYVLFGAIFLVILAYIAYWFIASKEIHKGVLNYIEEQRLAGYSIEHSGTKITGFPYRFSLEITSPKISPPTQEWTWQGEKLQVVMQTYNYNHFIGFAPGRHTFTDAKNTIYTADTSGFQASYSRKGEALKRISIIVDSMDLTSSNDENLTLSNGYFHVSPMPDAVDDMRILLGFEKIKLPNDVPDAEFLGSEIGPLKSPIAIKQGMKAIEQGGEIAQIVNDLDPSVLSPLTEVRWGPLDLKMKTEGIRIDSARKPKGLINLRLENIKELRTALEKAGKLDQQAEMGLTFAEAAMKKDGKFLPITLSEGKVKFITEEIADLEPLY